MAEEAFDFFDAGNSEVMMPSVEQNLDTGLLNEEDIQNKLKSGTDLISEGLDRAILGETVKSMMIAEDASIALPNYVIDFSSLDEIYEFQMEGVDALLHPDGEVTLYANTRAGLSRLGRGESSTLDRILTIAIANLFDSKCRVYRDFEIGKEPVLVSSKDITTMRLSI